MQMLSEFQYSQHAIWRLAQRGISSQAMQLLLDHGDSYSAGWGCQYVQMSKQVLKKLSVEGVPERVLRSASSLQAVVSADGELVTCYHTNSRRLAISRRRPAYKYH